MNMIGQYMSLDHPFASYDIIMWVISTLLLLFFSLITFYQIKFKPKDISQLQKSNANTWAASFLLLVVSNTLMLLWKYVIDDSFTAAVIDNIIVALVNIAILIKIIHIEYSINRYEFYKGYYFTIAIIALFTFTMLFTPSALREIGIFQVIYLILFLGSISIFPLMFIYLAIRLKGRERFMALRIVIGAALLGVGYVLQPQNIEHYYDLLANFEVLYNFFLIFSSIFVILGTCIIFSSFSGNL
jgi:hypothetical protein